MKTNINKMIGLGSTSRVGKDLLAELLGRRFEQEGFLVKKYALAYELKKDCEQFLKEKLNLDVWSNDTEIKSKFREFLVWYGKVKREESQGAYWTGLLQERIEADYKSSPDRNKFIAIVTDIRYCDPRFPKDEVYWIKKVMRGILINLDRKLPDGSYVQPANKDEETHSLRVRCASSYEMRWHTDSNDNLITEYINPLYQFITKKFHDRSTNS